MSAILKWALLQNKVQGYRWYVESLKEKKGFIAKIEYKKHKWFLNELETIIKAINDYVAGTHDEKR